MANKGLEIKEWLKRELKGSTSGNIEAMFTTTLAILEARLGYLKGIGSKKTMVLEQAKNDVAIWYKELNLTDEDEVED